MKLSIIICVYNTQKTYFSDCLKSVFDEKLSDFEVIIVDDGSSLDYSDVLANFPVKYIKTENRGLLEARLCGIEMAIGEYVAFVDSDDIVSLNYHQPMVCAAERENADIVINDWAFMSRQICHCPIRDSIMSTNIDISSNESLLFYTSQKGREQSYFVQWNKIFKRTLLNSTKSSIHSEIVGKHITYAEDALMNFFNFKYAKKVINVHSGFYLYRTHAEQSVVAANEKQLKTQIDCMAFAFKVMEENCENNLNPEIVQNIVAWRELMSRTHYKSARLGKYTSLFPYIKEKYKVDVLKNPVKDDIKAYTKTELLGKNFRDIDLALTTMYSEHLSNVIYEKRCCYVSRIVDYIRKTNTDNISATESTIVIPKRIIPMRDRIVYNSMLYRMGLILFKKDSKIRSYLKKLFMSKGSK